MLLIKFEPKMREEEVEAGGGYDELSFQLPPQEESMPATESEDAVMSDQALTEVQSQAQPLNDVVDLQLTTNDEIESHSDRKLINNLRAQSRKTVVTMKTQIESLMVQVNVLVNQLGDADLDQQKCEHKLRNTQAQLATTRKALESSKAKRKRQNGMVQGLRANLKETKAIVHSVQATNSDLQDELAASQEALSSCRDDLFSLQPLAPVADSSIVQELEIISQEVVHWIETEVAAFENAHPEAEPEQIFSVGNDKEVASFLQKYPAAGEHLARYLVHRFFQATLYGKGFDFLGLKKETAQLLQKAEHSMAKRDPPRDSVSIAKWRSETLQALTATEDCQQIRKKQIQDLNIQLFTELGATFPNLFAHQEGMIRFYLQVLMPAAKVATTFRTSTSTYKYAMADNPFQDWPPLGLRHMKTHKMLDLKNGSYLKPNAAVVADEEGTIGKFIIPLEPGLYRTKRGGDETTLRPVIHLVELNHPVAKRSQRSA